MQEKSIIQKTLELYTSNLVLIVPQIATLIVGAILIALIWSLGLFMGTFMFFMWRNIFALLFLLPLILVLLLVLVVVAAIANGVTAHMAVDVVYTGRCSLGRSFEVAKTRIVALIVSHIIAGIVVLVLSLIPVVGRAIGLTLFTPLPILIMRNIGVVDSLGRSISIVIESIGKRIEVPLVIFLIYLVASVVPGLGLIIFLLGVPYAILLVAQYMFGENIL